MYNKKEETVKGADNMIHSNERKLALSGWLQDNKAEAYGSPLRLQKFLFLYEAFSKTDGDVSDFSGLKGYEKGPVFSAVWGDYTKENNDFSEMARTKYGLWKNRIDEGRVRRAGFIVSTHTEEELSRFTHRYNIWSSKYDRIFSNEKNVPLEEKDFNRNDYNLTKQLENMFPDALVQDSVVYRFGDKYFVFNKENARKLTEQHADILSRLSGNQDLYNPVFVTIEEEGGLLID